MFENVASVDFAQYWTFVFVLRPIFLFPLCRNCTLFLHTSSYFSLYPPPLTIGLTGAALGATVFIKNQEEAHPSRPSGAVGLSKAPPTPPGRPPQGMSKKKNIHFAVTRVECVNRKDSLIDASTTDSYCGGKNSAAGRLSFPAIWWFWLKRKKTGLESVTQSLRVTFLTENSAEHGEWNLK